MIKKWALPNFDLIMSESVAEIDFHQKNSLSTMSFFANPGWVKWHPLKQTKSKNKHHFSIPTFWVIQLCFLVQKDSSFLKALKCTLCLAEPETKCIFKTFGVEESFRTKKQSCITQKVGIKKWCLFFDFVCLSGCHFT